MPLTLYILEGEYFLLTAPDLTSCHDWVVSRVMPLMLCGPLIAWMVMSGTREVVQIRLCMGTTRTRYNKGVLSPGCLFAGRFHYLQGSCVSTQCFYSNILTCFVKLFKILASAHFSIPVPATICACFTVPIVLTFVLVSQYQILFIIFSYKFLVTSSYPCSCNHVMV